MTRPLVVGIGNRARGDDGAGPAVSARVRALCPPGVDVVEQEEPLGLLPHLNERDRMVVVDAVAPQGCPGRLHVLVVGRDSLPGPSATSGSTHGFGVIQAVELAGTLGRLPRELVLVGVEAATFEVGHGLSPAVSGCLDDAARVAVDAATA